VGQGLALMQESLSEMSRARLPLVVLNMARGQGDYFQSTRGGGHGDYSHIVLAPADVREGVELAQHAFDLADRWRTPVIVVGDYYLAHTQQSVLVPTVDPATFIEKPWAVDGTTGGSGAARFVSPLTPNKRNDPDFVNHGMWLEALSDVMAEMEAGVQPVAESLHTEDAELVLVAYGTPARYLAAAIEELRAEGIPVGLVRPVTLWPFPSAAIAAAARRARGIAVFELNRGQMLTDVRLAAMETCPVTFIGGVSFDRSGFGVAPSLDVESLTATVRECHQQLDRLPREASP
jgi:2-oxoglutarate ferredoxin oxidoreductase subunit alpha